VVYLGICDGNMEEGSLRCDANVSVRARGQEFLNPKTEIKNLNSFRHVERALAWEVKRQTGELEHGETLVQATRLWDEAAGRTRVMRTKEEAEDYRYFPEPDLPPLVLDPAWIEAERGSLPELPEAKEERMSASYRLTAGEAHLLAGSPDLADYFEAAVAEAGDARATINWVVSGILRLVKEDPAGLAAVRIRPEALGRLVSMVGDGTISGKIAKTVFEEMARTGAEPGAIVAQRGLRPVSDAATLREVAESVLASHPGAVAEYLAGKEAALQFFMGQMMRRTRGQADPEIARRTVREALESRRTS
jgi:aspartyl-tRNA(Asn)/glutamyl-tRNA(Gln) amidotransferase subunit B